VGAQLLFPTQLKLLLVRICALQKERRRQDKAGNNRYCVEFLEQECVPSQYWSQLISLGSFRTTLRSFPEDRPERQQRSVSFFRSNTGTMAPMVRAVVIL
jgi:hypothetical protein